MKKISTLFKKNPENLSLVIDEVNPENMWVFEDNGVIATRKFDGTACAVIYGFLYKRYDVKEGRKIPIYGAIPCQEPDAITGHWPHWLLVDFSEKENKYFLEAWNGMYPIKDGTYELCGPKINGNMEGLTKHELVRHGEVNLFMSLRMKMCDGRYLYSFDYFKRILEKENIEGIVFYHPDGRMCKLRKSDFGIKRNKI